MASNGSVDTLLDNPFQKSCSGIWIAEDGNAALELATAIALVIIHVLAQGTMVTSPSEEAIQMTVGVEKTIWSSIFIWETNSRLPWSFPIRFDNRDTRNRFYNRGCDAYFVR